MTENSSSHEPAFGSSKDKLAAALRRIEAAVDATEARIRTSEAERLSVVSQSSTYSETISTLRSERDQLVRQNNDLKGEVAVLKASLQAAESRVAETIPVSILARADIDRAIGLVDRILAEDEQQRAAR